MAVVPIWAYIAFLAMLMISFSVPSTSRLDPVTGDDNELPKGRALGGWGGGVGYGGWGSYGGGVHGGWYGGGRGGGVPYQCVPVPSCPCHAHPYTLDGLNEDIVVDHHHGRQLPPPAAMAAAGNHATEPMTPDMYKKGADKEGSLAALAPDESN